MTLPTISRLRRFGAALAAMHGVVACSTSPAPKTADAPALSIPRTADERKADETIAKSVRTALSDTPEVYAGHVGINSDRGVVRLSGFVFSVAESRAATRITMTVAGVRQVANDLEVLEPIFRHNR